MFPNKNMSFWFLFLDSTDQGGTQGSRDERHQATDGLIAAGGRGNSDRRKVHLFGAL